MLLYAAVIVNVPKMYAAGMHQADLKRCSRLENQSASIDASEPAGFFPVSEHPKKKGLGVNKRNRGYPTGFEFIERPLNEAALSRIRSLLRYILPRVHCTAVQV